MEEEIAYERVVQLLGCKWSVRILALLKSGPTRPSELQRNIDGLPARVMHRCLGRMEKDGLIAKEVFADVPPHTEYSLTSDGFSFISLMEQAKHLAGNWKGTLPPVKL